jgi:hypothetical protein
VLTKILKFIILTLIQAIEWIEYRNVAKDENNTDLKIFETLRCQDWEVLSDSGYVSIFQLHQTQPYRHWHLKTASHQLDCADTHIIFDKDYNQVFVKDLKVSDQIWTENGLEEVTYVKKKFHKVSMFDMTILNEDMRLYTSGILSHNTVTSGIFLAWYVCFHVERNILVMANKGATMVEIIDKIKEVLKHLPFFLKPGLLVNNQGNMKFDNGCRLFGQATTKSAAIGFTIHLLFADEFAHIQKSYVEPFYRSIYPTLSSSKISRFIITSTPNGMNKFYEIYTAAKNISGDKNKCNDFHAMTTYWYQVPGRDEAWKRREIGNLGSEELFNQEYGLQFIASSATLLGSELLKLMKAKVKEFKWKEVEEYSDLDVNYDGLTWDPDFDLDFTEFKFTISVDIAGGKGGDYSIINIFRIQPIDPKDFSLIKIFKDEADFFQFHQVGLFRTNISNPDEFAFLLEIMVYSVIGIENIKLVMEMNFSGEQVLKPIEQHKKFEDEIVLYTQHTEKAKYRSKGIRWNKQNKPMACNQLKGHMQNQKIVICEKITYEELASFGANEKGSFSSMIGHDDIAMTCVNLTQMFQYEDWYDIVEELYDQQTDEWKKFVDIKLDSRDSDDDDDEKEFNSFIGSLM